MASNNSIHFFIKFGNEVDMLDLLNNGSIYFNSIEYFQKLEEKEIRGDPYEGTFRIKNHKKSENLKLEIKFPDSDKTFTIYPVDLHIRSYYSEIKGNMYCLFSVTSTDVENRKNFSIDKRLTEFGSHMVVITKPEKFAKNIFKELKKLQIDFEYGLVEYYDKNKINGDLTFFDKPKMYDYQKEFRIFLKRNSNEPLKISIGSIKEYADIFESKEINDVKIDLIPPDLR